MERPFTADGLENRAPARLAALAVVCLTGLLSLAGQVVGQVTELTCDGLPHAVPHISHDPQVFQIPFDAPPYITFTALGGTGGRAKAGSCVAKGGLGARATVTVEIGNDSPNQLLPGSLIYFVIGKDGPNNSVGGSDSAQTGGGGGTAILYEPFGQPSTKHLLAVGGGGGGAYQGNFLGNCINGYDGGNAQVGMSGAGGQGSAGGDGSNDGTAGESAAGSGGGGGHMNTISDNKTSNGKQGFPFGGVGGTANADGGFGYGGGGAAALGAGGGGGGGYSGGGAGDFIRSGGGGGSYVNPTYAVSNKIEVVGPSQTHGLASYVCLEQVGAESCEDASLIADGVYSGTTAGLGLNFQPFMACSPSVPLIFGTPLWYSYQNDKPWPVRVTASTCGSPSILPSHVVVLGECGDTSPIACGDDNTCQSEDTVTWDMQPGETHLIRVSVGVNTFSQNGDYVLTVSSQDLPPLNDSCAAPIMLNTGTTTVSLIGATVDPEPMACSPNARDVWFSLPAQENLTCVEVTANSSSAFDALALEAFSACGVAISSACTGAALPGESVSLTWSVPAGQAPLFRLGNQVSGSLFVDLQVSVSNNTGTWEDLGGASAGSFASPAFVGSGALCSGGEITLGLTNAPPFAPTLLWLSTASTPLPYGNGVLYAFPNNNQVFFAANASGSVSLSTRLPQGWPSQVELWLQFLVLDSSLPSMIIISNAMKGTTP